MTWTQLGIHAKPCGVLDVGGYLDPLVTLLEGAVAARFVRPEHRDVVVVETDPATLVDRLAGWTPPSAPTWLDRTQR